MTLDDYRLQVVHRLTGCRDSADVRGVLGEVDIFLAQSQISERARRKFWEAMNSDLDVVSQESPHLMTKQTATGLSVVIRIAKVEIFQHHLTLEGDN